MEKNLKLKHTTNLEKFVNLNNNRDLKENHVARLVKSFNENGFLVNPIIVNERLEVIDGQHRLAAAKELKVPIYYIEVKGYTSSQMQVLNENQKNWTSMDFLNSYADDGVKECILVRDFLNNNKGYNISVAIKLFGFKVSKNSGIQASQLNKGKLMTSGASIKEGRIDILDYEKSIKMFADYKQLEKIIPDLCKSSSFFGVVFGFMLNKSDVFSIKQFIKKIEQQPSKLVKCSNVTLQKLNIEDVYNYRRNNKINLRY